MGAHPIRNALLVVAALVLLAGLATLPYVLGRVDDPSLEPRFDAAAVEPPPTMSRIPPVETRRALFGDLHVHTGYSVDAYIFGVRALPDDAYHFAKGGTIEHGAGYPIRLSRPLDFLAVTDHAEYLGTARAANAGFPTAEWPLPDALREGNRLELTRYFFDSIQALGRTSLGDGADAGEADGPRDEGLVDAETARRAGREAWLDTIAAAERHDDPGTFTALIAYEWSSFGLHRCVIYGSDAVPEDTFSSLDSPLPQDLWTALEAERAAGQPVIAIPHNMNESAGRMYPDESIHGLEWTAEEAMRRRRIEPVSEIYQVKGSSETHPALSPDDPFADFEIVSRAHLIDEGQGGPDGGFARDGLRTGLELALSEGWNPYVFGVIGSSDGHGAASTVEEDNHFGKLPVLDGSAAIRAGEANLVPAESAPGGLWGGGGLAAVWAEENTHAAIFAALERRETFATSGPRMQVRFFGGWDFDAATLGSPDAAAVGYRDGVPMGGFLGERPPDATPHFLVWADKDASGANLDRLQIVKGWVDASGTSHERVYDVAAEAGRARDPETGFFEPVGDTVDVANARYTNTIGATHLEALWVDPDFDPRQDAFYYVRLLEIPTPRLHVYDAKVLGTTPREPTRIQERAATSAIWYDASGRNAMQ